MNLKNISKTCSILMGDQNHMEQRLKCSQQLKFTKQTSLFIQKECFQMTVHGDTKEMVSVLSRNKAMTSVLPRNKCNGQCTS